MVSGTSQSNLPGTIRRLWVFGKPYRAYFVATAFALVVGTFAGFLRPYLLKLLTDDILTGQSLDGKTTLLAKLLLAIVGATILKGLFSFLQSYWLHIAGQGTVRDLREAVYAHVQKLPVQWFESNRVGDLIVRFTDDLRVVVEFVCGSLVMVVSDGLTVVMSLGWMVWKDWKLTVVAMVVTPAAGIVVRRFSRRVSDATETAQKKLSDLSSTVKETVEGIKVVKSFNQEQHEARRFSERSRESFRWGMRLVQLTATQSPILEVLATLGIAVVLWYCTLNILVGNLTLGDLFAFWAYMLMATTPINRFGSTLALIHRGRTATNRLLEILDAPAQENEASSQPDLPAVKGRIEFRDVRFRYEEGREEALRGVSFTIEPGQHVVLVGRNGAGKSTLVNLIPRFYELTDGEVRIDGHSIQSVNLPSLRRQIAIVPQETFLFSGTVAENIGYGREGATREEIEAAAHMAGAHDFVQSLPNKYDTVLDENGRNLSGGQRQRVAIARMVLRDPAIVILDEATSNLDPDAERSIQEALRRATRGKTVISIVHRLTLAQAADRIIVLDQGRVVEDGTHAPLMEQQGVYWTLCAPLLEGAGV